LETGYQKKQKYDIIITVNTLDRNDYYSQRNNAIKPNVACNVTSMIMSACQAGRLGEVIAATDFWNGEREQNGKPGFKQPEDSLIDFINKEPYKSAAADSQGERYRNSPEEVWAVLVAGFNDWIFPNGHGPAHIDWSAGINDLMEYVDNGSGIVGSGEFPGTDGHFVNIGGYTSHGVIINDPWGNYLTGYTDKHGYDVEMPFADFQKIMMPYAKPDKFFIVIVSAANRL